MVRNLLLLLFSCILFSTCFKDEDFDVFFDDYDTLSWHALQVDTLNVTSLNGNITATPHIERTIDAVIFRRSWGVNFQDAEEHVSDIKINQSISGNLFSLSADFPRVNRRYIASFSLEIPDSLFLDFFVINGDLNLENLISDAKFRVDNGTIETKMISGNLLLEIKNGTINILDHKGNIKAETLNGGIYCSMLEISSDESIEFKTTSGSVTLQIPQNASIAFELSSRFGSITINGFDDISYVRDDFNYRSGEINGGEASVFINCESGNINVQSY